MSRYDKDVVVLACLGTLGLIAALVLLCAWWTSAPLVVSDQARAAFQRWQDSPYPSPYKEHR